jgi:tetratricopeptide (TPR) repeat protein/transcriptional regulator with XRE-family HTH domain
MAVVPSLTFGQLLVRYRVAAGMTQETLAAHAGVSVRAISDLERSVRLSPYKSTIALLAEALHLSPQEHATLIAAAGRKADIAAAETEREPRSSDPPFVGRHRELVAVEHFLGGGGLPVLFLTGEPGIGKSRLLRETADRAAAAGWMVLEGSCQRRGRQEPYAPFLDALSTYVSQQPLAQLRQELAGCTWLVRLLPELAGAMQGPTVGWMLPPEQERRLMFASVRRFLANVAGAHGTLLVLDDLQWVGADALDLLSALVRSGQEPPLRLACAYRNNDVSHAHPLAAPLADLAHARLASHLELGPLDEEEAALLFAELIEELGLRDSSGDLCVEAVRRASGVPFFLVSCAQAVHSGMSVSAQDAAIPWDVAQSIGQRVAALPALARDLLGAAAVVGEAIPDTLLIHVVGAPEAETLSALDAVRQAGLLVESDANSYQFAHDLVRDVVISDLSSARRKALHRRIARLLERQPEPAPVEVLAYHFGRAGEQQQAIAYLERAGDRAHAMRAYADAEASYRELLSSLEGTHRPVEEIARAQEKLGLVLYATARFEAAVDLLDRAMRGYRASGNLEGVGRTSARLGWAHANRGTVREGTELVESAIAELGPNVVLPGTRAELHVALATLCSIKADYRGRLAAAGCAADLARAANDRHLIAQAELHRAAALDALHHPDESLRAMEKVIPEAEAAGDLLTLSEALNAVGQMYEDRGEFDTSMPYMDRAVEIATLLADPVQLALLLCNRGQSAFYIGHWDEARRYHERAVTIMQALEVSLVSTYPYGGLGLLSLAQGQRETGLQYLQRLKAASTDGGNIGGLRYVCCILAEYELLEGSPEAALALLTPLLDRPGQEETGVIKLLPLIAWADHALDRDNEAEAAMAQWTQRVYARKARRLRPDGLRIQAMLARYRGQWDVAQAALEEALALCEAMGYPYCQAKVLYDYAFLLMTRGDLVRTRQSLESAQSILDGLGEHLYAAHVYRALDEMKWH